MNFHFPVRQTENLPSQRNAIRLEPYVRRELDSMLSEMNHNVGKGDRKETEPWCVYKNWLWIVVGGYIRL